MKIRSGFVSNSSSSSFVVQVKSFSFDYDGFIIEEDKLKKLLDCGFKYTPETCPEKIEWNEDWQSNNNEDSYYVGMSVVCNENNVTEFLLNNDIPFKAITHYGHYSLIWNGKDKIKKIRNLGLEIAMYGDSVLGDMEQEAMIEEYTKKEWLEIYR